MQELKEQIQIMRKQLEAQMEDSDESAEAPESPREEQPPQGPVLVLQETPEKLVSREYEQLQFDVSRNSGTPSLGRVL